MIYVPEKFRPKHPFPYPPDNTCEFERWYYENYDFREGEREYLPIFWTAFYCRHKFGQHKPAMVDLRNFLNKLDRSKKYYTIVQYDGGLLHDVSHLDIKVFSMSGGRTDYPLPLIAQDHKAYWYFKDPRPWFVNFIGKNTHPLRQELIENFPAASDVYISSASHYMTDFCYKLRTSTFTLCPRGFGPTSFRIQEALQQGSIPVYVSDEFVTPHNIPFEYYGVIIEAKEAKYANDILRSIPKWEICRRHHIVQ